MSAIRPMFEDMTLVTGLLLKDDDVELWDVELRRENGYLLNSMYDLLGCRSVDVIRLTDSIDLWVDDEGMLVSEPKVNTVLMNITYAFGHGYQPLFGSGLFLSTNEDGETVSLTPEQVVVVRNAHKQALVM